MLKLTLSNGDTVRVVEADVVLHAKVLTVWQENVAVLVLLVVAIAALVKYVFFRWLIWPLAAPRDYTVVDKPKSYPAEHDAEEHSVNPDPHRVKWSSGEQPNPGMSGGKVGKYQGHE